MQTLNISTEAKKAIISYYGSEGASKVFAILDKAPTHHFMSINGYQSSVDRYTIEPKVANYVVQLGRYETKKASDKEIVSMVKEADIISWVLSQKERYDKATDISLEIAKQAKKEILEGLVNPKPRANYYVSLGNGFSIYLNEGSENNGKIAFHAYKISEQIIEKGKRKYPNSSAKTLAKQFIRFALKSPQYRTFYIKNSATFSLQKQVVEI